MPLSVFYLCWCFLLIKRLVKARRALKDAEYYTPAHSPPLYVNTCSFYSLLTFNLPVVQFYSFCSFAIQQDPPVLFERTDGINTGGNPYQQRSKQKNSLAFLVVFIFTVTGRQQVSWMKTGSLNRYFICGKFICVVQNSWLILHSLWEIIIGSLPWQQSPQQTRKVLKNMFRLYLTWHH